MIHLASKLYIPKGEWNSEDAERSTDTESTASALQTNRDIGENARTIHVNTVVRGHMR